MTYALMDNATLTAVQRATGVVTVKNTDTELRMGQYLDARLVLQQYQSGSAPACLPIGEFRIRHFGTDVDCNALEEFFQSSEVELLGVEVIRIQGQVDFAYKVRR